MPACIVLPIFDEMKKTALHILCWISYWLLLAYLEYLWLKDYLPAWPMQKAITRAVAASFLYGLPQLALAYYISYFALEKIVQKKSKPLINLLLIVLPYITAICLVILLARELILPILYEGAVTPAQAFFDPRKFISIMIEAAFPAGLLMAIKFVDAQLTAKEREKNLIQDKLTTELQLLKSQLNPHFLFNTLNNIYALTRKKSDLAPDAVLKLSELLRFTLYEAGNDTIVIEKELQFLDDYIAIQQLRYGSSLSINFEKSVDDPSQPIAPLLLLSFIENAFKHGASEHHFDSFIRLCLHLKKGQLSFTIENSLEASPLPKRTSPIGINNASRQLEMLYREHHLTINNSGQVFSVQLTVNLHSYGKI